MEQLTEPTELMELRSGLELIRAVFEGRAPQPGVTSLIDMDAGWAEHGRTSFELQPHPKHSNPQGTVHGGILATMLDSAMTCAVITTLPPGQLATTLDLQVRFLRPVPLDGQRLIAEGIAVHTGGRYATAEGRITGMDGTLYATGTTSCMVLR